MKKFNLKLIIFLIITILFSIYVFIFSILGTNEFVKIKTLLNHEQRQLIKRYLFPYKLISQQEKEISRISKILPNLELEKKNNGTDISIKQSKIKLSNRKTLEKYKLLSGFYNGINFIFPGSGYIDFYENNIFVLSSRGILAYIEDLDDDKKNFKQVKNNINEFIGLNQFKKHNGFSLKDLLIIDDKIFVSFTEEIKENCWNTSVIYADMNYESIKFRKLFTPQRCIHAFDNKDLDFNSIQSGGKLVSFGKNNILLSIGDYRSRYLAQDKKSINGKIVRVNIINKRYEIISMGHRNPQGLYYDEENKFILETEHGPKGGDEINLILIDKINQDKIQNYGWPISSAGEHYEKVLIKDKEIYEKYPLYKSHEEYGFIEPLYSFVPSIGISEVLKITKNQYVVSSLGAKSLYFFELNKSKEIINLNKVNVFERVRDLRLRNNKLYLFMENSASIGVIDINIK